MIEVLTVKVQLWWRTLRAVTVYTRERMKRMGNEKQKLLGYLLKKWSKGVVLAEKEFPPTPKGLKAAQRLRRSAKQDRPGRPGQAVTITPIYERAEI